MRYAERFLEKKFDEREMTQLERELDGKNDLEIIDYFSERFRKEGELIPRDEIFGMKHQKYCRMTKIMSMYSKNIIEPLVLKLLEDNKERLYQINEIAEMLNLYKWSKHASLILSSYSKKKDSDIICVMGRKYRQYKYSKSCSEAKRQQRPEWKNKGFCFDKQCGTDECPRMQCC
jgi:hypothetical protein